MNNYLVNSVQSSDESKRLSSLSEAVGYITHYRWIICDNEHRGYAMIEADSEFEALLSVPPLVRENAKVYLLNNLVPNLK
jgi:hypothetical protein